MVENRGQFKAGNIYRHFKGNEYVIQGIFKHTETEELYVAYVDRETRVGYIRPLEMFKSEVDRGKYPEVSQKYRFEYIGDEV